jgi:PilZ domain
MNNLLGARANESYFHITMLTEPLLIKPAVEPAWPAEVDLILSAMEAAEGTQTERREHERVPYRVRAELRLFSDLPGAGPWIVYTRDINERGLGFITPHRLPLGYGGWIEMATPRGRKLRIHCTLFRCREAVKGWFDGALYFNREQHFFKTE